MIVKTLTETKRTMSALMDAVEEDREPVLITRGSKPPAILMSYEEYRGWRETLHLISSPANARRLDKALASHRAQEAVERPLAELDE